MSIRRCSAYSCAAIPLSFRVFCYSFVVVRACLITPEIGNRTGHASLDGVCCRDTHNLSISYIGPISMLIGLAEYFSPRQVADEYDKLFKH